LGVDFSDIVEKQKIELEYLSGRRIAFDAFNNIYQFLSIIRQPDGTPLMDSSGKVTSHLSGLFYRTIKLVVFRDFCDCFFKVLLSDFRSLGANGKNTCFSAD